ncbi:MAG: hypothetical protein AAB444_03795 [Patescibacteria group bacterium]
MTMRREFEKAIIALVFVSFFSTSALGGVLLFPLEVRAQLLTEQGPFALGETAAKIKKEAAFKFWPAIGASFTIAIGSAIDQFAQQFAYDLAVNLASGLKGQNPLAFLQRPGDYFTTLGLDAAGEAIGTLGDSWGVDICNPRIPDIALGIGLGIAERFQRPKPRCKWANIVNNYNELSNEVQDPKALLKHVSASFDPGESDLSQAAQAQEAVTAKVAKKISTGLDEFMGQGGIRAIEDKISGLISTPAAWVKKGFDALGPGLPYTTREGIQQQAADIVTMEGEYGLTLLAAVGTNMMSVFTNTLAARTMKMGMQGLMSLLVSPEPIDLKSLVGGSAVGSSVQKARGVAADLLVAGNFNTAAYDILSELSACPDKAEAGTQFSCAMDRNFADAVRASQRDEPMTVAEAVEKGLLDMSKPFGFTDPVGNIEPDVNQGYAYSNMKKLRMARVIPIGWELAALEAKSRKIKVTLGEVVDGFNKAGDDGICGTNNIVESPFCGLVDPNWVLKAPLAQCAARSFGSITDAQGYRREVCADLRSCISEDNTGNCRAWGYCTREQNIWRFKGDACETQFASCENYRGGSDGKKNLSLLETTLDFGACNADNAGCKWYSQRGDTLAPLSKWFDQNSSDRIYLDGDAQVCKEKDDGCTEFLAVSQTQENLVPNPSFERDEDNNGIPDGWSMLASVLNKNNASSFHGSVSIKVPRKLSSESIIMEEIPVEGGRAYVFSLQTRLPGAVIAAGVAQITFKKGSQDIVDLPDPADIGATCIRTADTANKKSYNLAYGSLVGNQSAYQQKQCTFTAPADATTAVLTFLADDSVTDGNKDSLGQSTENRVGVILVDAIQLEPGVIATDFRDGYTPSATASAYLRHAPAWLGCDGEPGEPDECVKNYARVCRQEEVGCERYTPTSGDPAIPGVITDQDRCPAECVGYASYKQEVTNFEPAIFPEYLIPSQAQSCNIEHVGCSQFTNLATEALEYYSFLRACQKPRADDGIYYTWEGAEQTGYQLRTWRLKKSLTGLTAVSTDKIQNSGTAIPPCTNINALSDTPTCTDILTNQATCLAADVGENPLCRAFYDKDGNIFYRLFVRTVAVSEQCNKYRVTYPDIVLTQNQTLCEKFSGTWNTPLSSCSLPGISTPVTSYAQLACQSSHGSWDDAKKECVFAGYPAMSASCPSEANSCRLFSGNAGSNVQTVLGPEGFEGGSGEWINGTVSAESSSLGGHSLKVTGDAYTSPPSLVHGESYILTLWAKGIGNNVKITPKLGKTVTKDEPPISIDNSFPDTPRTLQSDWKALTFGPIRFDFGLRLTLSVADGTAYIDNIILRQVNDQIPLLKNSITIPLSCDRQSVAAGGGYLPQAMLGCSEYNDRAGEIQNLKSFSRFCRDESVGCQELIDTQNSAEMESREWNTANRGVCRGAAGLCKVNIKGTDIPVCSIAPDEVSCQYGAGGGMFGMYDLAIDNKTVATDRHVYLVADDTKKKCAKEQRGCQALGYKNSVTGQWGTVYLKSNPDDFARTMCKYEEDKCAAWTSGSGSAFFKDPTERVSGLCEWRTQVNIGGREYSGWFIKGDNDVNVTGYGNADACTSDGGVFGPNNSCIMKTPTPCYGDIDASLVNGEAEFRVDFGGQTYVKNGAFGIWGNYNPKYTGKSGECPRQQSGCTEFLDPTDNADPRFPAGKPYYYIDNGKLDRSSCGGNVSREEGCVLFDQTDIPQKQWSALDSYYDSVEERKAVPPRSQANISNDVNTLLKVQRDRTCSEWLSCRSAATDPVSGQTICNFYGRCSALGLGSPDAQSPECATWQIPPPGTNAYDEKAKATTKGTVTATSEGLDIRATTGYRGAREIFRTLFDKGIWFFQEPSGYSIPNQKPIEWAREFVNSEIGGVCNFYTGFCTDITSRACQSDGDCTAPVHLGQFRLPFSMTDSPFAADDTDPFSRGDLSEENCSLDKDCGAGFVCNGNKGKCVVPKSCRGYPAIDSPVSRASLAGATGQANNLCAQGNCDCSYIRHQAKGVSAYYPFSMGVKRICTQGDRQGAICYSDSDCSQGAADEIKGYCATVDNIQQYVGWRGFCLDYDKAKAVGATGQVGGEAVRQCLTWAPIVALSGESTAFLQAPSADYKVASGKDWYCVKKETEGQKLWKEMATVRSSLDDLLPHTGAGKDQPGSIENINNFFDKPFFKDGTPVTQGNLLDGTPDGLSCGGKGGDAPGQWCTVAMAGFESFHGENRFGANYSNLLGCYNITDDKGSDPQKHPGNFLFFPYKHQFDAPIYAHTIDKIEITIGENWWCDNFVNSGDRWWLRNDEWDGALGGGQVIEMKGKIPLPEELKQMFNLFEWKGSLAGEDGAIGATARFDRDGRFLGIEIEAHDNKDTGSFGISKFSMQLKPACQTLFKVTSDDARESAKVYSDNIRKDTVGGVDRTQICEPFGAMALDPKLFTKEGGYAGLAVSTGYQPREPVCAEGFGATPMSQNTNFLLNNLFARAYKVLELHRIEEPPLGYVSFKRLYEDARDCGIENGLCYKDASNAGLDKTETEYGFPPTVTDIKVNSKESGDVAASDVTVFPVNLSFFGGPDGNQMPLRRIAVEWDDGTPVFAVGNGDATSSFKARRPSCDNRNFGYSPEGCEDRPFSFSHTYFCPPSNGAGLPECNSLGESKCWDVEKKTCRFKPGVQILDNWGFCNKNYDEQRCTDPACKACNLNGDRATWFSGMIIVKPPAP